MGIESLGRLKLGIPAYIGIVPCESRSGRGEEYDETETETETERLLQEVGDLEQESTILNEPSKRGCI